MRGQRVIDKRKIPFEINAGGKRFCGGESTRTIHFQKEHFAMKK
jgi:hypothetical protein